MQNNHDYYQENFQRIWEQVPMRWYNEGFHIEDFLNDDHHQSEQWSREVVYAGEFFWYDTTKPTNKLGHGQ